MKSGLMFGSALALLVSGCASMGADDATIADRTAFSLGMDRGQITISDRVNDMFMARYLATAQSGKKYNCEISTQPMITSTPICTVRNSDGTAGALATACNDLLRAAKKC
jgi:hypothetical protein